MIKVLHYLRHLGLGGTEKSCQLFVQYSSLGVDPIVVYEKTGTHPRLDGFKHACEIARGKLIEIDSYGGYPQSTPSPADLQRVIDDTRADILHIYRSGYPEFPVGYVKIPHVVETNAFGFLDPNSIDRTLFMSKWLMHYALKGVQVPSHLKQRFDFVNNPVEEPHTDAKLSNISSDITWLGRCGRPDNGIYNAINVEAARLLRQQGYNLGFLVVAPPSNMVADLEKYDIPFHVIEPTINDVKLSRFYNSVDIYAHARADGETFGVNIAEAMMHGKPVVTHIATPSVSGMGVFQSQTELVDDGETGYIVQNDPSAYAEAIKQIIDDEEIRLSMGIRGYEKAMLEYEASICQKKLENIYSLVLK